MRPSDLHNLEDECRREVNMRRSVFDKKVRAGGMDRRQADYQVAQMERLVVLLEALQHADTVLTVRVSPNHIAVLQPEQISDWLADPAAYGRAFAKGAPAPRLIDRRWMPALETSQSGGVTPLPNPPPQGGRETVRSVDPASSRTHGQRDLLVHAAARSAVGVA
jgi:hypothetical protein